VQIEQRMDPNALKPGDESRSPEQRRASWEKDMVNDLHHDDALWLWAAKAAHTGGRGGHTQQAN